MPIVATDIQIRYSGGAANGVAAASLGGIKSSVQITDNVLNNIFDDVSGTESAAGSTEYRAVYIHNAHASITMQNTRVYIATNSTSTDTTWEIGLGSAAVNATEQTIANEITAPSAVTFVNTAISYATGLVVPDIPFGQHKAIWYKRIVTGGATAFNNDTTTINFDCDTAA